jgi:hypothetical protein
MITGAIFMLDTNVFNRVVEGKIDAALLKAHRLVATGVQHRELVQTRDDVKRAALLSLFEDAATVVANETFVWGVSAWGQDKWGTNPDGMFAAMHNELELVSKRAQGCANTHDVMIAETALRNGRVLVTHDSNLFKIVTKYGGACANGFLFGATHPQSTDGTGGDGED